MSLINFNEILQKKIDNFVINPTRKIFFMKIKAA